MKLKLSALTILNFLLLFGILCRFSSVAHAADYQNCATGASCTLGEFLYDDSYTPDATASCTLTSHNPDGTVFLNSVAMTASPNGWYSYSASIGSTEGVYPSQICCTTVSDYLCLDKTFQVVTGNSAAAIWSYPNRSLTDFGTLVADIWNNSTRSLSTFGDLVSNVWTGDNRTLSGTDSATLQSTADDIAQIKKTTLENRLLLEQLINKPIVKNYIDDTQLPSLSDKVTQTNTAAANLYSEVQNLKSRGELLSEKWSTLSPAEISSELTTLSGILKQDLNQKDSNLLATTTWLKTSWDSPIFLNLSDQAQAAQNSLDNLTSDINLYGKGTSVTAFSPALNAIQKMSDLVGTSLATSTDLNLYGFIKKTTDQIALLDQESTAGLQILTAVKADAAKDQSAAITQFQSGVLASNEVPQSDSFFTTTLNKDLTPANRLLGLLALVDTNKRLLAASTGQTVTNIWLEEGSIVFRTVATNPSQTLTQKVSIKYFLPTELKKEQIIKIDPELTVDFDPTENSLFASGDITLAPGQTRTFLVETEDIWSFKQEEIDSLKTQTNDLVNVLKNTSYYAQATSTKTDIDVALDKIMLDQSQAVTPENRIRTYRESALVMNGVEEKITSLKEFVLQANTPTGFLNSLGGVGAITIWGIVLIVVAGFVFLFIYVSALRSENRLKNAEEKAIVATALVEHDDLYHPVHKYHHRETRHTLSHRVARIASIALLAGGLGSIGAAYTIKGFQSHSVALAPSSPTATVLGTTTDIKYPYESQLVNTGSDKIPVRSGASLSSPEILSLSTDQKVYIFKVVDSWAQVGLFEKDQNKDWWINTQYLETQ